jgi:hypothetical protein
MSTAAYLNSSAVLVITGILSEVSTFNPKPFFSMHGLITAWVFLHFLSLTGAFLVMNSS